MSTTPRSLQVQGNGLLHHVLEWHAAEAPDQEVTSPLRGRTVFLVHGFMDAAGTWDLVAPKLAARGLRVLAMDMRGFGEGPRVGAGGYYHFADYVFDLAEIVDALAPEAPLSLVGHSMGGTIATLFSGTFPERVERLVLIEGVGPPDNSWEVGPTRMRAWISQVRAGRATGDERTPFSREQALARLARNHPSVPPEVLAGRLPHLARELDDGRYAWRFDPLHRTTAPTPFFANLYMEFARLVTAPVLFVSGGPSGYHPQDEAARQQAFACGKIATIEDAGHMVHWTAPDALARLLCEHFARP